MTPSILTTDHPAWTAVTNGSRARLMDTDSGLWAASYTSAEGLTLTSLDHLDPTSADAPTIATTQAHELPARLPRHLGTPLTALGTVIRVANPSLWDALSTAILRQVIRAPQARKVYRAWCSTHGTTVNTPYGQLSVVPEPKTVLGLADDDFTSVGAAFHRTALQAAAAAYLEHAEHWQSLDAEQLATALTAILRIGPWTAAAAASDFTGDFSVYPHHDLAVRTWARRIAPAHTWPDTEKAFGAAWRRMASTPRQLHALTLFTLTWGTKHVDTQHDGGTAP